MVKNSYICCFGFRHWFTFLEDGQNSLYWFLASGALSDTKATALCLSKSHQLMWQHSFSWKARRWSIFLHTRLWFPFIGGRMKRGRYLGLSLWQPTRYIPDSVDSPLRYASYCMLYYCPLHCNDFICFSTPLPYAKPSISKWHQSSLNKIPDKVTVTRMLNCSFNLSTFKVHSTLKPLENLHVFSSNKV